MLTGSMEPDLPRGALAVVEIAEGKEINEGDIVTLMINDEVTLTHRVLQKEEGEDGTLIFVTKGDANEDADNPITEDRLIGIVRTHVPYAGFIIGIVRKNILSIILVILVIHILFRFIDRITRKKIGRNNPAERNK